MVGPKLDSRSYTTLLLTVVALLLAMNLVKAQYSGADQTYKTEAAALSEVASATREVAKANERIAEALESCASAISKVKLDVNVPAAESAPAPTGAPAAGESTESAPASGTGGGGVVFDMGGN